MDSTRFDQLSRRLGAGATRRTLLTGLTGGVAALGLGSDPVDAQRKKKTCRPRCKGGAVCKRGKCKCRSNGQSCTANSGCCGALVCRSRACQPNCDVCVNGCEFSTVNAAVAAAAAGDTITVCPGTYPSANLLDLTQNVTIQGAGDGADPTTNTILTYSGAQRFIQVEVGVTANLRGLRLAGATSGFTNAIDNVGSLEMEDCTITNFSRGIASNLGNVALTNCTVTANNAGPSVFGGGLIFEGGNSELTDCTVSGNGAQRGAGLYVFGSGIVALNRTTVIDNTAADPAPSGGGIFVASGSVGLFNSSVRDNTPDNCAGNVTGGACGV